MTVCEMQREYDRVGVEYQRYEDAIADAAYNASQSRGPKPVHTLEPHQGGLGAVYCNFTTWVVANLRKLKPKPAHAATLASAVVALPLAATAQIKPGQTVEQAIHEAELENARRRRDRYGVEIQKKFSLAAACVILAFVGGPIALRFPRGGVGLVIGVSFVIFALYYIGLIGGETLANKGYVSPFWAMWAANIIFFAAGLILYARMGHEASSARGGDLREWLHLMRLRINGRSPLDLPVS